MSPSVSKRLSPGKYGPHTSWREDPTGRHDEDMVVVHAYSLHVGTCTSEREVVCVCVGAS